MRRVVLRAGALELVLAPESGGSIARFDHVDDNHRQHLLRPASEVATDVLAMASFPLVPFANRIRGGAFLCDGRRVELAPNLPGDRCPLHGQGWLHRWQVVAHDDRHARLEFAYSASEWPWDYEAWQTFALDDEGLTVTLGCRNLSERPMPCGLAQHPYFPCDEGTILDAPVAAAWTADEDILPVEQVPPSGRYELRQRFICGTGLDNAFEGWTGTATITWPDAPVRLVMSSPDARRFHIYSPVGQAYFAAEPVQNAVCALNASQQDWPALGIVMLAEGASHQMQMRLDAQPS